MITFGEFLKRMDETAAGTAGSVDARRARMMNLPWAKDPAMYKKATEFVKGRYGDWTRAFQDPNAESQIWTAVHGRSQGAEGERR